MLQTQDSCLFDLILPDIFSVNYSFFSLLAEVAAGIWNIYIYIGIYYIYHIIYIGMYIMYIFIYSLPVFYILGFKISFYKEVFLTFQLRFSQLLKTSFILPLPPKLPRLLPSCGDSVSRILLEIFHMRHMWMFILLFYIVCRLVTNAVPY